MDPGAIVIAVADPVPKVRPEKVHDDVATIATGRSDYPNQINTVLAFPSVFDRRVARSVAQAVADDAVAWGAQLIVSSRFIRPGPPTPAPETEATRSAELPSQC
jgi:malic enzyme